MMALAGKIMAINYRSLGRLNTKQGNWVSAVAPSKGAQNKQPVQTQAMPEATSMDDDIPFKNKKTN